MLLTPAVETLTMTAHFMGQHFIHPTVTCEENDDIIQHTGQPRRLLTEPIEQAVAKRSFVSLERKRLLTGYRLGSLAIEKLLLCI